MIQHTLFLLPPALYCRSPPASLTAEAAKVASSAATPVTLEGMKEKGEKDNDSGRSSDKIKAKGADCEADREVDEESTGSQSASNSVGESLSVWDICTGPGRRSFWPFCILYFLILIPGFGLKLLASAILTFTFAATFLESAVFTTVYLCFYGFGRSFGFLFGLRYGENGVRQLYIVLCALSSVSLMLIPTIVNYGPIGEEGVPGSLTPAMFIFSAAACVNGFFLGCFKGGKDVILRLIWLSKGIYPRRIISEDGRRSCICKLVNQSDKISIRRDKDSQHPS